MNTAIKDLRQKIDHLDTQIAALLCERMGCSEAMAVLKGAAGFAVHDPAREAAILKRLQNIHPSSSVEIAEIYRTILEVSRRKMSAG